MGDHPAANDTIWPSQNDIAQTAGDGKKLLENQWAKPATSVLMNNYALSGLTVPGTSGTLNIDVASGTALIAGRHITIPAATTITATANNTNYVYLKLTRDGSSLATGVSFDVNTSATIPSDSIFIATLTAGASTITATSDKRTLPGRIEVLTSGTTWTPPAGIFHIYVEVFGASGGGGGGQGDTAGENGGNGGAGGTTSFDSLSVTGGAGGLGSPQTRTLRAAAADGVGSGGQVNMTGGGKRGGGYGQGFGVNGTARDGGDGGYSAGLLTVTPGNDLTYAIGVAGSGGAAGDGALALPGGAGSAGRIVIHY